MAEQTTEIAPSLVALEWDQLCAAVSSFAVSDLGRERCRALGPAGDQATASLRLKSVGEGVELWQQEAELPMRDFVDCRGPLSRLQKHGVASAEELTRIAKMLSCALAVSDFVLHHEEQAPHMARSLSVSSELRAELSELTRCLSDSGEMRDAASAELARSRASVRALRRQVQSRLGDLLRRYREALQDDYFAEREGRYVLPVRADAPFRVEGIVFGTSGSGSTLYVEPKELSEIGNRMRLAETEVEREEARVLAQLSGRLSRHADELLWAQDVCERADLLQAIIRFARHIDAQVVPMSDEHEVVLCAARHPLLADSGVEVVANDLRVSRGCGLLLSGPNAGGKTVAMKCLGLLAVMQASGLPLPAAQGSRVGFFDTVFSDIGDDQSLSRSLSTFSGHVETIQDVLQSSTPGTLVLIDELMAGTDPNEGAVLAVATAEALVATGAAVVVTTHYEQLKAHAQQSSEWENAAVGFDFDAMAPTFRVEMGRPGASSALTVARRHGLRSSIVARATMLLPEVEQIHRQSREEIERKTALVVRREKELAEAVSRQELLNRRLEEEARKLKEARHRHLQSESDELRAQVKQARAELKTLRARMKSADKQELKALSGQLDAVSSVVAWGSEVDQALRKPEAAERERPRLGVGQRVRIKGMNAEAEILEVLGKGKVRVRAGAMKLTVTSDELEATTGGTAPQRSTRAGFTKNRSAGPSAGGRFESPPRSSDLVLDLRGMRVDESLSAVDGFIDELLRRREFAGYVLHGHGTGALKDAVRSYLNGHQCVEHSRPAERDEGGDAHTVFWLGAG